MSSLGVIENGVHSTLRRLQRSGIMYGMTEIASRQFTRRLSVALRRRLLIAPFSSERTAYPFVSRQFGNFHTPRFYSCQYPTLSIRERFFEILSGGRRFSIRTDNEDVSNESIEDALVVEKEAALSNLLDRTPDWVSTEDYLHVLRALAASNLPDAPLRAERWINRLEQHAANTSFDKATAASSFFSLSTRGVVIPTSECYQRVIEAWCGAIKEDAARIVTRAERWLWKNIDSPIAVARPDTACFNAFLDLCTKGRALKNAHGGAKLVREHALKAENVVRFMIEMRRKEGPDCRMSPDTETFNLLLRGWTRCRKSMDIADRTMDAFALFEKYQLSVDPMVQPNEKSYSMAMDSICVRAKLKVNQIRSPLGRACRNNPALNGVQEIQLLTNMIKVLHEKLKEGDTCLRPTTVTYNILLSCWANSAFIMEHAPAEAEKILREMTLFKEQGIDGIEPDHKSYLMVMRAWANSNKPNRGHRTTWLLSKQWSDFHFTGNVQLRPTVDSYNTVMRVWISLMEPLEAEKLLAELVQHGDQTPDANLSPNSESFSLVIRAWLAVAEIGSEAALLTAAKWIFLLDEREKAENGILSSVEIFALFFSAAKRCAKSSFQILDVTMEVFERLRSSRHTLDCLHFSRLLQVGLVVLSKEEANQVRISFLKHVITECKEAGLISSPMLQALSNGPIYPTGWTAEESVRMVTEHFPQWPLPPAWMRNVKPESMLPKESDRWRRSFTFSYHGPNSQSSVGEG
jgi:hypothetical protein